ncbi:MAG TPA: RES family NAD+ phosphorylase [Burkholderiales bacterium]|nr:RES family NAD+ phosphorylase [Burkholderiales bacterium]
MTIVHRIAKRKYSSDPLGGNGGLYSPGRWHHVGHRVVYCAASLSLASLEFFVHFGKIEKAIELAAFEITVPDLLIEELDPTMLPEEWQALPPASSTADIGTEWLRERRSAVLMVPSVLSLGEFNYLINPAHPQAPEIIVTQVREFRYDGRMWKE